MVHPPRLLAHRGAAVSVETLAAVLHHSRAKGTAKLVLVGIANHDGDGGSYPAVSTLAKYANVDERNVQRALDKLVALGELVVYGQQGGTQDTPNHRRTNRYAVLVTCPVWCDRTTQHRDTRAARQANLRGLSTRGGASATPRRQRHPTQPYGVAPVPPVGVAPAPPKPSLEPPNPTGVVTQPQTARAICEVCTQEREGCKARQRRLAAADRHEFKAASHATR